MLTVAAILGEPVAVFELGIVSQVFGLNRDGALPQYDVRICTSGRKRKLTSNGGLDVVVPHGLEAADGADILVVPGWTPLAAPIQQGVADVLRRADERGAWLLSICSGSFAIAASGVLDGRRATTHWQFSSLFARSFPDVRFDPSPLYVHDNNVITSAGASAGLDASLHLVRVLHGDETATRLAQQMVAAPHRSGSQAQHSPELQLVGDRHELGPVLTWIDRHLDEPLNTEVIARRANSSTRTLARRFHDALGVPPHRYVTLRRVARAARLLESTDLSVDEISTKCGYGSADTLRHHFAREMDTTPTVHRSIHRGSTKPT